MTLRIAHVISTPAGVGGAERVVAALLTEGIRMGWEQKVFNPFSVHEPSALAELSPVPVEAYSARHLWQLPRGRAWLIDRLDAFRPDVVHVHLFHAAVLVASLARREGRTTILTHHHGELLRKEGRHLDEWLDRIAGRQMDLVVAVSESVARFLQDRYGYPPHKVRVIRNGWEGTPRPRRTKRGEATIVCVSNFRPEKAHDDLIRAFSAVKAELPEARLLLVGSGPLERKLRNLVDRLQLDQDVLFLGHTDHVWPYLAEADVFALASTNEPLGIAVLEALAAGLPVVATDVGGLPEIVDHGIDGRLVPPGDPAALAETLLELLRSPEVLERMSNRARESAEGLRMERTIAAYRELYESLRISH